MRSFQRPSTLDPVPARIVALLRQVDRSAGAEARHLDQLPQLLVSLREQARIESVTASSAIEGVTVDERRAPGILAGRTERFRTRSEAEFAGYTAALDYLYDDRPGDLTVGLLLHLHRLLFSQTPGGGGSFKTDDNLVVNREADGTRTVRFEPVTARETPFFTAELVERATKELSTEQHHPLVVSAACVLDLTCIHPFTDGNGRIARLLTTHLLDRAGYQVGRYVSIEQLLYETKDDYYAALAASTVGWFDDGKHSVWPWVELLLDRVAEAYRRFEARIAAGRSAGTKRDRVQDYVLLHAPASFTIAEVRRAVPGVSDNTIRIVLTKLRDDGRIAVDGVGPRARWKRLAAQDVPHG
jgi:Fic family protein